jgi:hypothetical protein
MLAMAGALCGAVEEISPASRGKGARTRSTTNKRRSQLLIAAAA